MTDRLKGNSVSDILEFPVPFFWDAEVLKVLEE